MANNDTIDEELFLLKKGKKNKRCQLKTKGCETNMSCGCNRNGDCCGRSFEKKCYECGYEIEKGTETVVDGKNYHKRHAPKH